MSNPPMDPRAELTVRDFAPGDEAAAEAALAVLQEELRASDPRLLPGPAMAAGYLAYIRGRCAAQDGRVFLATAGAAVAGLCAVWIERDVEPLESTVNAHAYVSDLVVFPAFRRQGVAGLLLAAAQAHGRDHGMADLQLNVLAANADARRFYEAAGFSAHRLSLIKPIPPV